MASPKDVSSGETTNIVSDYKFHVSDNSVSTLTKAKKSFVFERYHDQEYHCDKCGKKFKSASVLKRHKFSHTDLQNDNQNGTTTTCNDSNIELESSPGEEGVTEDCMKESDEPENFVANCDVCSKTFTSSNALLKHLSACTGHIHHRNVNDEKLGKDGYFEQNMLQQYNCNVCDKSFRRSVDLERHSHTHSGEKKFKCKTCGSSFTSNKKLKLHRKEHNAGQNFWCGVCKESVAGLSTWRDHTKTHHGEKIHQCRVCNTMYSRAAHLKRHATVHSTVKRYSCDVCGDNFSLPQYLARHKRIHTGEKPYVCDQCAVPFRDPSSLRRHMRIHSGERPYSCKICNKAFISSGNLKRHMRSHTGEKPFLCTVCGKSYKQRVVLQAHMMCHSGERPHHCPVCNKGFIQKSNMKIHYQNHHLEVEATNAGLQNEHVSSFKPAVMSSDHFDKGTLAMANEALQLEGVCGTEQEEIVPCSDSLVIVVSEGESMKVVVSPDHELIVSHSSNVSTSPSDLECQVSVVECTEIVS